jgi:hypothetical protein
MLYFIRSLAQNPFTAEEWPNEISGKAYNLLKEIDQLSNKK